MTRYDRVERNGRRLRIHQEDFCQALGKPPEAKYERNRSGVKGPRLVDMFAVMDTHRRRPIAPGCQRRQSSTS